MRTAEYQESSVRRLEKGEALKDEALSVPAKIAGCICLEPTEAMQLYRILYKILGKEI